MEDSLENIIDLLISFWRILPGWLKAVGLVGVIVLMSSGGIASTDGADPGGGGDGDQGDRDAFHVGKAS
jgi:hypothetical protein